MPLKALAQLLADEGGQPCRLQPAAAGLQADPTMMAEIRRRTPIARMAEVEEMAGGILFLSSAASSMVTGHTLAIDGGWTAV